MIDLQVKRTQVVQTENTLRLNGDDILDLIRQELKAQGAQEKITKATKIQVYVTIPGGGDYSGMDLDIDDRCPVVVTWNEVEEK